MATWSRIVMVLYMQDTEAGQADRQGSPEPASPPAMSVQLRPLEALPGIPQQLRSAVEELTDVLKSADKSLQASMGSPVAHHLLDPLAAPRANPAEALRSMQSPQEAPLASHKSGACPEPGTASVPTATSLAAAAHDDMEIDSEPVPRQQELPKASVQPELQSVQSQAAADVAGVVQTLALRACQISACAPEHEGSKPVPPEAAMAEAASSAQPPVLPVQQPAPEPAAPEQADKCGTLAGSATHPTTPVLAVATVLQQHEGDTSPELMAKPGVIKAAVQSAELPESSPGAAATDAAEILSYPPGSALKAQETAPGASAAAVAGCSSKPPDSVPNSHNIAPGTTVATLAAASAGGSANSSGINADSGTSSPVAKDAADERDTPQTPIAALAKPLERAASGRSGSPDFGGAAKPGSEKLASVLDTVGKLCKDLDPTSAPFTDTDQASEPMDTNLPVAATSQAAEPLEADLPLVDTNLIPELLEIDLPLLAVRLAAEPLASDPQAAAMLADRASDASAKAACWEDAPGGPALLHGAKQAAAAPQVVEDSAHTGDAHVSFQADLAGSSKGLKSRAKQIAASAQSAGSAGSWDGSAQAAAQASEAQRSGTTLTATKGPARQASAERAAPGDDEVDGAEGKKLESVCPATPGMPDSKPNGSLVKKEGAVARSAQSRAAGSRAKQAATPASGSSLGRTSSAAPVKSPAGSAAAKKTSLNADKGDPAGLECKRKASSSSRPGIKTTANTTLTPKCIYG